MEIRLCGHATLASAHVLWESGRLRVEQEARQQVKPLLGPGRHEELVRAGLNATLARERHQLQLPDRDLAYFAEGVMRGLRKASLNGLYSRSGG